MTQLDDEVDRPDTARKREYVRLLNAKNFALARPALEEAVHDGDSQAMGMLGALYMLGQGVQRDAMSAFKLFQRGAKLGDPASQTAMGLCLCSGRGADPDFSLAAFWLYRAARQKYAQAVGVLGWLVETKPEVVGEHFSMDDVCQVLEDWRRAKVAAQHQSLFESMTSPQGTMH